MSKLGKRTAGVLLHPTSLPGPYGVGDLGPEAHRFVSWLAEAGQSWWQMLPVGPPGFGDSPYQPYSSFAGNPLLIALEPLREAGYLTDDDLKPPPSLAAITAPATAGSATGTALVTPASASTATGSDGKSTPVSFAAASATLPPGVAMGCPPPVQADFAAAAAFKLPRLRKAYEAFEHRRCREEPAGFEAFCAAQRDWLDDYALFCALKDKDVFGDTAWYTWNHGLRSREANAVKLSQELLNGQIRFHRWVQYQFSRQWDALRSACRHKGIGLIGDVPIFVGHDSADVWARQEIFLLDGQGRPTVVAGVPPDYFSADGQLWGNPLYKWDILRERGYDWWVARLKLCGERFDAVRLDHFIGFHRAWHVPANAANARGGEYRPGPGEHFFAVVAKAVPQLQLLAEDLGVVTPEVEQLRDRCGLPGMRVLHFSFGGGSDAHRQRPHAAPRNCVIYTGTHDNDTTIGWLLSNDPATAAERALARKYVGNSDPTRFHWDMVRCAMLSPANTAVVPMQDVLGLDSRHRMNAPGTVGGRNWRWRMAPGQATSALAGQLREMTELYGRLPSQN